jgi:hypothetical protein
MTKYFLTLVLCAVSVNAQITDTQINQLADIIFIVEGGNKTKYPYGIKSIDTKGNKEFARRICINTIRNNYKRWTYAGKTNSFVNFLGNRFCPPTAHKLNQNWQTNVSLLMQKRGIVIK